MQKTFYLNLSSADDLGIGLFKYSLYPAERFIIFNSSLSGLLGYPADELKKLKFGDLFFNSGDRDEFYSQLRRLGKVRLFETIFERGDHTAIWVMITASSVKLAGTREHIEGIIEDISSHKEMERDLLLEKDFLQGLLDNIPDAVYFKDRANRIIKVNKFYVQGTGLKDAQIIGKTDFDFFPREQAQSMFDDDNSILTTGKPLIGKIERTILSNGTWNQVITTKIPMYNRQGQIIGTMGITRDMTAYANLERERLDMLINTLSVLAKALEMRDPYTAGHMNRVGTIAERVARALGWDGDRLLGLKLAGELHDIGKISIPLDILNKPGSINDLERRFLQGHVDNCYNLIKDIKFPFPLAEAIRQHHERLDGSGYPRGLLKDQIIMEARILSACDVLEAITHHRPYRAALGLEAALQELRQGSGTLYDPLVVETLLSLVQKNNNSPFWLS